MVPGKFYLISPFIGYVYNNQRARMLLKLFKSSEDFCWEARQTSKPGEAAKRGQEEAKVEESC